MTHQNIAVLSVWLLIPFVGMVGAALGSLMRQLVTNWLSPAIGDKAASIISMTSALLFMAGLFAIITWR